MLKLLRESEEPLGAAEVAQQVGVHLNTARFHLDTLVSDGHAVRGTVPRTEPGRPKVVYSCVDDNAAQDTAEHSSNLRLLAEILTGIVSSSVEDPVTAATEAGRAWGSYLTRPPSPIEQLDADEGQLRLMASLTSMGFAPDADNEGTERQIRLHHCPFREVAQHRQDIACAIHLGLLQGTLTALKAPLVADQLSPLVTSQLCVATLRRTDVGTGTAPAAC